MYCQCKMHFITCVMPGVTGPSPWLQANVFNLREKKVIRDLNPEDIEQLVSVSGMVTRCSNIIPEIRSAQVPLPSSLGSVSCPT